MPEMPEFTDSNRIWRLGSYIRSRDFNELVIPSREPGQQVLREDTIFLFFLL